MRHAKSTAICNGVTELRKWGCFTLFKAILDGTFLKGVLLDVLRKKPLCNRNDGREELRLLDGVLGGANL